MSDNDPAMWNLLQSGKAVSDRHARLGLDQHHSQRAFDSTGSSSGGGGGSILVSAIFTLLYYAGLALFWIVVVGLWLMWQIVVMVLSAIFSSRR